MKLNKEDGTCFYINNKKEFEAKVIDKTIVKDSFDFANSMVFGEGYHRGHRSGGQHNRKKGELFANTFQGKLAEFIIYTELVNAGLKALNKPDISISGKGIWDDTDLEYKGKKINIKSAAFFSNLLLLETKDWNKKGEYIPNLGSLSSQKYDYFLMVRIKPDVKQLFQKERIFYSNNIGIEVLEEIIFNEKWFFDIAGFCSDKTIRYIINEAYLLPQNARLNGSVKMDADNYYIQAGDLKDFRFFVELLKEL